MNLVAYALLAVLLSPLLLTVAVSFTPSRFIELPRGDVTLHWYREFFSNPVWTQALLNSLGIALVTAIISVFAALATAVAVTRHHFRGKAVWEAAVLLPMTLPAVALAVGMLAVVRLTPLWGHSLTIALAHSVMALPVAFLLLRASLKQVDRQLEEAARGLGAAPWRVFRFVTLPLVLPAVAAAALFALVISLNEITLTLFLATRDTETLPRVIWPNLRFALTPLVAAASVVLLVQTLSAVAAAGWWLRPRTANHR